MNCMIGILWQDDNKFCKMEKPDIRNWEKPVLRWSQERSHRCFAFKENGFEAHITGNSQYFSGAVVDFAFKQGKRYFFELRLKREEAYDPSMEIKVGLTIENTLDIDCGFSDRDTGWSYYLFDGGLKRHSSNLKGDPYGEGYEIGQDLGVYVDMMEGTLAFSVDGRYYGPCFTGLNTEHTYYAAVAMNNRHICELVRKTPAFWETCSPALFVKCFSSSILGALKPMHFREILQYL